MGEYTDTQTDAQLAREALAGKEAAYTLLMQRHRQAVFRLARHHIGEESEALDVTQEAFIAAFAALSRYDGVRPFRSWLLKIALNKCHDWARRRAVRQFFRMARPLEDAFEIADPHPDPEMTALSRREVARIGAAIASLPANLKEPLILCKLEGWSATEAANFLRISEKAVETRIYRARQKLSAMLEG